MSVAELLVPNSFPLFANSLTTNNLDTDGTTTLLNGQILQVSGTASTSAPPGLIQVYSYTVGSGLENYLVKFVTEGICVSGTNAGISISYSNSYRIKVLAGVPQPFVLLEAIVDPTEIWPAGTVGPDILYVGPLISFRVKDTNGSDLVNWTWTIQINKTF